MKKEKRILSLAGLTSYNIESFYTVKFNRWLFDNSDNVWINDILIDKNEKLGIQLGMYNIKPEPINIKVDGLTNGFKLTEKIFLERELESYNKLDKQKFIIKDHLKIIDYINFLETKLQNLSKVSIKTTVSLKSQETFALYCHYANINPNDYTAHEISNLLKEHGVTPGNEDTKRPYHSLKTHYNNYQKTIDRIGADSPKASNEKLKRFNTIIEYCKNTNKSNLLPQLCEDRDTLEQNINNNK